MTAELHHNAVVAAIRGDTQLASVVFEVGEVPTDPAPTRYVVVASSLGDWSQTRFTGSHDGLLTTHTVYCVGTKAEQARWVAGRVTPKLNDVRLPLAGRQAFRPAPWITRPVVLDRDGLFPLPFGVIQFDLYSEPV